MMPIAIAQWQRPWQGGDGFKLLFRQTKVLRISSPFTMQGSDQAQNLCLSEQQFETVSKVLRLIAALHGERTRYPQNL